MVLCASHQGSLPLSAPAAFTPSQPNTPGPGVLARESREQSGLRGTLVKSDQLLVWGGPHVGTHLLLVSDQR